MSMVINPYAFGAGGGPPVTFNANDWANCTLWLDWTDIDAVFQNTAGTTAITADGQSLMSVTNKGANSPGDDRFIDTGTGGIVWKETLVGGNGGAQLAGSSRVVVFQENNASFRASSNYVSTTAFTMFALLRINLAAYSANASDFNWTRIMGDTGAARYFGMYVGTNSGRKLSGYNWDGTADYARATITDDVWCVATVRHKDGNIEARVNDGSWVTVASGTNPGLANFDVFASQFGADTTGSGKLLQYMHHVCYNVARSDAECDAIVAALMAEAGL